MNTHIHHKLGTSADRFGIEVWADEVTDRSVTLYIDDASNDHCCYIELTPIEARALAALLVAGAAQQEAR